jgi:hypothetical protein
MVSYALNSSHLRENTLVSFREYGNKLSASLKCLMDRQLAQSQSAEDYHREKKVSKLHQITLGSYHKIQQPS